MKYKIKTSLDKVLDFISKSKALSGGYAVLELLFYISLFAVFSVLIINSMITMTKSFRESSIQRELAGGGVVMERISREIRQAYSVSSINATDLTLNSTDISGANKTVRFLLSGSDVEIWEDGVVTGNLNPPNLSVSSLSFTQIISTKGRAIRIILSVISVNDVLARTVDYHDTVVLRGSY